METRLLRSRKRRDASVIEDTPPLPTTSVSSSPPKKRNPREFIESEKGMVFNTYKYVYKEKFEQEKLNENSSNTEIVRVSKNDCVLKTAEILGISTASIYRVLAEEQENIAYTLLKKPSPKKSFKDKYDEFTFSAIRRNVHIFFYNNKTPTVAKVLQAVNNDEELPTFTLTTMRRILKYLNFECMKGTRRNMLIDRQDIISWRRNYLLTINDLRKNGTPIFYQFLESVCSEHNASKGKGRELIVSHIGNEDGFVDEGLIMFTSKSGNEDYDQDMKSDIYEKWLRGILPKLKPNSVLVTDNAPYHSRKIDSFPDMSWLKSRILEWMKNKNIDFTETSTKSELIDIAKPYKDSCNKYVIDEMARENGITVFRLPLYHSELNPIELVWRQAKGHVAKHNKTFKMEEVQNRFLKELNNITSEKWKECVNNVIKTETKMLQLDHLIDLVSDRFVNDVSDDDSDNDGDDDDGDDGGDDGDDDETDYDSQ